MRLTPEKLKEIGNSTIVKKRLRDVTPDCTLLKPISNNKKVGKGEFRVLKGKLKGLPMYGLTLEERKTCPTSCFRWDKCYGNNMMFAYRYKHGYRLESKLRKEVSHLADKHPGGFIVRLHILGDFYSVRYCELWNSLLSDFHKLYIWGNSARYDSSDICASLKSMARRYPERFLVRFSANKTSKKFIRFASNQKFKGEGIRCPHETGLVESCLTCGLCFNTNFTKTVKFHDR